MKTNNPTIKFPWVTNSGNIPRCLLNLIGFLLAIITISWIFLIYFKHRHLPLNLHLDLKKRIQTWNPAERLVSIVLLTQIFFVSWFSDTFTIFINISSSLSWMVISFVVIFWFFLPPQSPFLNLPKFTVATNRKFETVIRFWFVTNLFLSTFQTQTTMHVVSTGFSECTDMPKPSTLGSFSTFVCFYSVFCNIFCSIAFLFLKIGPSRFHNKICSKR